jgi:hypothetical protein
MKQLKAYIRMMREAGGKWGIAWAVWIAVSVVAQLGIIAYQSTQPGPYESAEKTDFRRNVNTALSLGIIGLMIPCMQNIRRWQEMGSRRPVPVADVKDEETAGNGAA